MAAKPLPDANLLRQLLRYEPETGKLFWLARTPALYPGLPEDEAARLVNLWNGENAGKEAFLKVDSDGYLRGSLLGRSRRAHRVIWKLVTNGDPAEIDHIDGNRANNRLANLRAALPVDNATNRKNRSDNTSGKIGVGFSSKTGKWRARIRLHGKRHNLGEFDTLEDAIAAREKAEARLGFHLNHGRHS